MLKEHAIAAVNYLINESNDNKDLNITFFGGEPLLEFELIRTVIEHIDSIKNSVTKNISYSITTNGTIANDEIFSFLKDRFNLLLSIDGDRFSHNRHRRFLDGTATFDIIMENCALLKKYQPWLGAHMTVCPDTVEYLSNNVKFLFGQGIRQFLIETTYGFIWSPVSLLIYQEQMRNVIQFYTRLKKANEPVKIALFEDDSEKRKINSNIFGCSAGKNSLTVSPSGNLFPCRMMRGFINKTSDYCLGNVFDGITQRHLRDDFIALHCLDSGLCASCDAMLYCRGGCPVQNYYDTGSIDKPAKYTCEIAKINKSLVDEYTAVMRKAAPSANPKTEATNTAAITSSDRQSTVRV